MTDTKDLPKKLPPMQKDFTIEVEGKLSGKTYRGEFTVHIMNSMERARADIRRAQLNQGIEERYLDPTVAEYHYQIGYLRYALVNAPKWWVDAEHGYSVFDGNVVDVVFTECIKFEREWMETVWGKPAAPAPAEGSNEQAQEGG